MNKSVLDKQLLDEAIQHCKEVYERQSCTDCGLEHKQLMIWLTELKLLRFAKDYENTINDYK